MPFASDRFTYSTKSILQAQTNRIDDNFYLDKMVKRKKIVVDGMLRKHQDASDPLVMRMTYLASECKYNVTNSLKRPAFGSEKLHTMSVVVDMKRISPTIPNKRNIVEYSSAAMFAEALTKSGVDAFLINTDEMEYGGALQDLKETAKAVKRARPNNPPALIAKDIFLHPIQVRLYTYVYIHTPRHSQTNPLTPHMRIIDSRSCGEWCIRCTSNRCCCWSRS